MLWPGSRIDKSCSRCEIILSARAGMASPCRGPDPASAAIGKTGERCAGQPPWVALGQPPPRTPGEPGHLSSYAGIFPRPGRPAGTGRCVACAETTGLAPSAWTRLLGLISVEISGPDAGWVQAFSSTAT